MDFVIPTFRTDKTKLIYISTAGISLLDGEEQESNSAVEPPFSEQSIRNFEKWIIDVYSFWLEVTVKNSLGYATRPNTSKQLLTIAKT